MKVTLVTPYWAPVRGGTTTYVQELAAELRRTYGLDVTVIAREGRGEARVTVVGGTASQFIRRAATELERLRPNVVHAQGHWYALEAGIRYRRNHPGTLVVFTLHTPFPPRSWWRRYALKFVLSKADFVTGVSAAILGTTIRAFGFRTRTRVTHPGVSLVPASAQSVAEFLNTSRLAVRGPIVGYLGRLVWDEKVRGVAHLIRAMKMVRMSFPSATLVVAGDGPHRTALEELAAREAAGCVVFLGDVEDPVPRFYDALDLYAHISFQEGLPLAVLEAMACGRPVVASAVGGIPEIIRSGENGFLVSEDLQELSSRIVELLSSPDLAARLAANALADVAARFTWTHATERFLPLYGVPSRHRVAITVDLERDYQAPARSFRGVEEAMPKILALFEGHGVRATVFATSDLCDRFPDALMEIRRRGHALGCHGESHDIEYLSAQPYEWQLESLRRATEAIEQSAAMRPRGFRAPNFSANGDTIRALEELGYDYDSSVLPGRLVKAKGLVTRVDFRVAPRDPYRPSRDDPALPGPSKLWELPVAENPLAPGGPIGLGYLNVYGVEKALEAIAQSAADPCVFLVHPWELIDPAPGPIPEWMRTGCTSDTSNLDAFLARVRLEHDLTTLDAELAGIR